PFIDAPIEIQVSGPATLIGPARPTLRGGATACWIRSSGATGTIIVTVSSPRFESRNVQIAAS
ncbi:MAG: hypothetical protein MI923_17055, partial [Phycisphaerales bacterium]|nr:hypothetical protein [Phycisphaerales bacterium]